MTPWFCAQILDFWLDPPLSPGRSLVRTKVALLQTRLDEMGTRVTAVEARVMRIDDALIAVSTSLRQALGPCL